MTRHEQVAAYVRRTCPDAAELLLMIGATDEHGVVQPDDEREYGDVDTAQLGSRGKGGPAQSDDMLRRPEVSTAPAALRVLPPVEAPKPAREPKSPRKHRANNPKRTSTPRKTYVGSAAQIAAAQAAGRSRQAPCGRYGAYRRHLRNGEPVDEACAEAAREQSRARERDRGRRPQQLQPCGSDAGYRRHIRRGTDVCAPCRAAHNERNRQLENEKRAAA